MNENEEHTNSTLQEFTRTSMELFQLILLYDDKIKTTSDIIIESDLYPELDRTGFLEEALVDLMVIRLSRLYKIHDTIGKVLNEEGEQYAHLFSILSSVWSLIKSNKEKIELWRNARVAHSEDQSKKYVPIHILDKDHENTIKNILLSSRLAVWYYNVIRNNVRYLFDVANSVYSVRYGDSENIYPHKMWKMVEIEEEKIIEENNNKLTKNGFITVPKPKFET